MPRERLVPVLAYTDVDEAVSWLGLAFGFELRWQAGAQSVLDVDPRDRGARTRPGLT
jgi:hypothetical protein